MHVHWSPFICFYRVYPIVMEYDIQINSINPLWLWLSFMSKAMPTLTGGHSQRTASTSMGHFSIALNIISPQISKISIGKIKENLQSFSDCRAGWSKELQWGNGNFFYKCIEGKLGICLLLAIFIGEDWMVNLMIIYIKKIIAKALDFDDIIKKVMGMSTQWVQIS